MTKDVTTYQYYGKGTKYDALKETMDLITNGQIQATFDRKDDESVDLNEMIIEIDNEQSLDFLKTNTICSFFFQ